MPSTHSRSREESELPGRYGTSLTRTIALSLLSIVLLPSLPALAEKPEKSEKTTSIAPSRNRHIGAADIAGKLVGEVVTSPTGYPVPFLVTSIDGIDVAIHLMAMEEQVPMDGDIRQRHGWLPVHTYLRFEFANCSGRIVVEDPGHSEETGARTSVLENHLNGTYVLNIAESGPSRWLTAQSVRNTDDDTCYQSIEKLYARFAERSVVWPYLALYSVRVP